MKEYIIVTDSTTDLPASYADLNGINVLPLGFMIDGKKFSAKGLPSELNLSDPNMSIVVDENSGNVVAIKAKNANGQPQIYMRNDRGDFVKPSDTVLKRMAIKEATNDQERREANEQQIEKNAKKNIWTRIMKIRGKLGKEDAYSAKSSSNTQKLNNKIKMLEGSSPKDGPNYDAIINRARRVNGGH